MEQTEPPSLITAPKASGSFTSSLTLMHHLLYKVTLYQHEQKRMPEKTCTCAVSCSWSWSLRPQSSNFDVTSSSSSLLFTLFLDPDCVFLQFYSASQSGERTARCSKTPKRVIEKHFFLPGCSLGLCKAPWVSFPFFVCVRCCAFDLCCAQLFPHLKKARRPLPEVWCLTLGLYCSCFSERQTNKPIIVPLLSLSLLRRLKTENQLFLCHRFELNQPTIQNCVWNRWGFSAQSDGRKQEDRSKQVSLLCFYLSKTPAVHLLTEINLTLNFKPSFGLFLFLSCMLKQSLVIKLLDVCN